MPIRKKQPPKTPKAGLVVGSKRFAKISAVESIHLNAEMIKRSDDAEKRALSPEERRAQIIESHRKR